MNIENEALFRKYAQKGINLFLGAGFSVEAESTFGKFPVGDGLKDELIARFGLKKPSRLTLPQICSKIQSTKAAELREFLRNRYTVTKFDPKYYYLEQTSVRAVFTTNIDDLIHKIYQNSKLHYVNDLLVRGPSISGKNAIEYIPLHGCVAHPDAEFDFTPIELASSFARDKDKWFGFVGRIQRTPTLYWGYRLEDAGVLEALHKHTAHERDAREAWVTLRTPDEETTEYFKSIGFQIIIGSTVELLDYFRTASPPVSAAGRSSPINLFPEFNIPASGASPARSIIEFYSGAEPSWSDIHSGLLHQTAHYLKAKNTIARGKNLMLLGTTATGKSTLLRQLASTFEFEGTKLFVTEISKAKADLLLRAVEANAARILIFLDNAADSTDASSDLMASPSLQMVMAERDYFFDTVSHRFERSKFALQDVSDLDDHDIQEIEKRIPREIIKGKFKKATGVLSANEQPTLFEVVEGTIRDNSLSARYIKTLSQIKTENLALHDLLAMICYLYSCRVPTSVDVASSFLYEYAINVAQVHEMISALGGMVSYYEGALSDEHQDYFVPRSGPVSDAVMTGLREEDLRRLLWAFHRGVSTTRIPRYDVFKRHAYDARYASRAFPLVKEGIEYYDYVYDRDPSPYLRQQGALYCLKRNDVTTAFHWIDDARAKTGDRNPTIRNTYAVILFQANVGRSIDGTVTATLQESMEILKDCYRYDKRKVYHAKVFTDQALAYVNKFGSTKEAIDYLELAREWLLAERSERPDDRRMKYLLRTVSQRLGH